MFTRSTFAQKSSFRWRYLSLDADAIGSIAKLSLIQLRAYQSLHVLHRSKNYILIVKFYLSISRNTSLQTFVG
ncbi:MAG: hypothetical protein ABI262_09990 [Microcoleus sp.]